MRQDLLLSSNPPMLAQRTIAYPCRATRSSSLPLKIINQNKNSDKLIHSWNGNLTCTRLCMYTNLSVSDFCINLIGNDLPISSLKELLAQRKEESKSYTSSDESISIQTNSESEFLISSESENEIETQFSLEQLDKKDESDENNDLTLIGSDVPQQETSSGYLSMANESSTKCKLVETSLDETCRNLDDGSSSEDELFKDFRPKKSCLKKLYIDCSGDLESANATSSPLNPSTPTSPSFSLSSSSVNSTSISSPSSCSFTSAKKRVSFADTNGKELCTIRTMSEPSNCPPKLTSKIVEYFLNREFTSNRSNDYYSNYTSYGISSSCSSSDAPGSIAVYSLNFAQPAGDYLKFRHRLDENKLCLENVVLNRFCINGTIKVKNINFHKQVFIRCSFDKWSTYQDIQAQYVPSEYYSTPIGPSSPTSYSATFYEANYQPNHKDYDTFRFQFDLPQHVNSSMSNNNSPHNIIQFCVCYKTGNDEYWDNNFGVNYEILQYVIGINKPTKTKTNFYLGKSKSSSSSSCFRYDSAALSKATYSLSNQSSSIYY